MKISYLSIGMILSICIGSIAVVTLAPWYDTTSSAPIFHGDTVGTNNPMKVDTSTQSWQESHRQDVLRLEAMPGVQASMDAWKASHPDTHETQAQRSFQEFQQSQHPADLMVKRCAVLAGIPIDDSHHAISEPELVRLTACTGIAIAARHGR